MAADAVIACLKKGDAVDEPLRKKMLKAPEAYATSYCRAPTHRLIEKYLDLVEKVCLMGC